jgi:MoaA/NifB/PqqE/SkfB family radical SAM enzyme
MPLQEPSLLALRRAWNYARAWSRGRAPGQLIIQYTDKCNAACPQCDMRVSSTFTRSRLALDTAKRTIDHAAAQGVVALSITGGEPLLYLNDVAVLLKHAKQAGIKYTRTGTNGFMLMHSERGNFERRVSHLCETLIDAGIYTFWISLDSADLALHETLRGLPGVVTGIRRALPIFRRYGLYPSVNLGINRYIGGLESPGGAEPEQFYAHFRNGLRRFYDNVIDLGFTIVNCCYPMSVADAEVGTASLAAVYQASADNEMVKFTPVERTLLYRALYDTIPEYRAKIRIFSPRASLLALQRDLEGNSSFESSGCRGGVDYFFVDARDGNAYPCGYRGQENLGKFWEVDLQTRSSPASCKSCDWECWRDPSELIGPLLGLRTDPLQWIRRSFRDPEYFKVWQQDLRYMHACDLFDARTAPNFDRMARFGTDTGRALPVSLSSVPGVS